jgi:MFS family permease
MEGCFVDDFNAGHSAGADEPTPFNHEENIDPRMIGKARQVPTVAILMIVHGVLMFLAGCGLIALAAFVPQITQQIEEQQKIQRQQNPNAPQISKESLQTLLTVVYSGFSVVLFVIGTINVIAGILNYGYRYRVFGIISMVLSMGSILFCWCLPLSIGLLVFGMIVYLSPEAERAFRWQSVNRKHA